MIYQMIDGAIPRLDINTETNHIVMDCFRMVTFSVVVDLDLTLVKIVGHGEMDPGLSVTIFSMADLNM